MTETRKTVTIVFTDVVGSTSLGERLDPEAFRHVMLRLFAELRPVLERHGGRVAKFIGDAILAVFGIPAVHEDDPLRAVRASAAMREALSRLNDEFARERGITLAMRTGVNTGEVVVSEPSTAEGFAIGDAVNVAARLQQVADPGEILLGARTHRAVRNAVRAEPCEPLSLKGKADPVSAWRLLEVLSGPPAAVAAGRFMGRAGDLATLRTALTDAIASEHARLVTVLGPPGIGKSRLARELIEVLGDRARAVTGRCLPYGEGITYWPLAEIVDEVVAHRALEELFAGDVQAAFHADRIAGAVGRSEAQVATEEILWAVRKLVEALARERPLVAVVDDIHWAEPTFLDLLEYLGAFAAAPVLLLCLARPELLEQRAAWAGSRTMAITLEPLADADARSLLHDLPDGADLPRALEDRILDRAAGNPLFVEQMLALAREEQPAGELTVPPTIQALLAARIDRLTQAERTIVERAAVEGRHFHRRAVSALAPQALRDEVTSLLLALVRKDLIAPAPSLFPGDDGFRFSHLLVRDAAYDATPKQLRADLHERYAGWLAGIAENDEILGYHLEQACQYRAQLGMGTRPDLADRAAGRLAAAGRRALERGDARAAINLLARAHALFVAETAAKADVLLDLGEARNLGGDLAGADEAFSTVIELTATAGDGPREYRARIERELVRNKTQPEGSSERLSELVGAAVPVFEDARDDTALAVAMLAKAIVQWMACRYGAATELLEQALVHAERAGAERIAVELTRKIANAMTGGSMPVPDALRRCEALAERFRDNPLAQAPIGLSIGLLEAYRGRFDRARRLCAVSEAQYAELGYRLEQAQAAAWSGKVEACAGSLPAAERKLREACATFTDMGERSHFSSRAAELAEVLSAQGQDDEAERFTHLSEEATSSDDVEAQALWRAVRAKVLARRGEPTAAERLAREADALARTSDDLELQGDTLAALSEVLRRAGRPEDAAAALRAALERYERRGIVMLAEPVRTRLAELDSRAEDHAHPRGSLTHDRGS
jgi:class 3 adenylate cyclase/tetratricopeptide (TPR) repeat protein